MRVLWWLVVAFVLVACIPQPVIEKQYTPGKSAKWEACLIQCQVVQRNVQLQRNLCNMTKRMDMRSFSLKEKRACDKKDNMCLAIANYYYPTMKTEYDECNGKFDTDKTYDGCYVDQCGGAVKDVCTANCDEGKK